MLGGEWLFNGGVAFIEREKKMTEGSGRWRVGERDYYIYNKHQIEGEKMISIWQSKCGWNFQFTHKKRAKKKKILPFFFTIQNPLPGFGTSGS